MPRTSAVFALVALLAGCPASPRDDRIELLVRIDAAHDAAGGRDTEVAKRAIDALRATEVRPSRRAARDACVELYGAMVEHDVAYAEVTALLDQYERVPRAEWPTGLSARLRAGYGRAEQATATATSARAGCEQARGGLRRELATER